MSKQNPMTNGSVKLLGINFEVGGYNIVRNRLFNGALMIVPSAPSLVMLENDPQYQQAMTGSDLAIPDSGFLVLLLKLFKGISIQRLSGLELLRCFLKEPILREQGILFLVNPSEEEKHANHQYLQALGIQITNEDHYVAPLYDKTSVKDDKLLQLLKARKPRSILINLGGGVQEKLGYFLKTHLDYKPGIICTGAAIAFLTGKQVGIPEIADRFYLGWLIRCLWRPKVYVPRYLTGFRLIPMIWKCEVEVVRDKLTNESTRTP